MNLRSECQPQNCKIRLQDSYNQSQPPTSTWTPPKSVRPSCSEAQLLSQYSKSLIKKSILLKNLHDTWYSTFSFRSGNNKLNLFLVSGGNPRVGNGKSSRWVYVEVPVDTLESRSIDLGYLPINVIR